MADTFRLHFLKREENPKIQQHVNRRTALDPNPQKEAIRLTWQTLETTESPNIAGIFHSASGRRTPDGLTSHTCTCTALSASHLHYLEVTCFLCSSLQTEFLRESYLKAYLNLAVFLNLALN